MHQYLVRLTSLRFVAALLVVIFHFGSNVEPFSTGFLHQVATHGDLAVSFFFCLSGFVMATVYAGFESRVSKGDFWVARFSRIYPAYFLCVVFDFIHIWHGTLDQNILQIFLLQAWVPGYPLAINPPAWSLSAEAFFYLIFPAFLPALDLRRLKKTACAALVVWLSTQIIVKYVSLNPWHIDKVLAHDLLFYFPPFHLSEFLLGAVAGAAHRITLERSYSSIRSSLLVTAGALATVAFVKYSFMLFKATPFQSDGLYAPLFIALIWVVVSLPRLCVALLEHKIAVRLGEASYSLYLFQFPVLFFSPSWSNGHQFSPEKRFYIFLPTLIAVSLSVYYLVERPARTKLRNWMAHASRSASPPLSQSNRQATGGG